MHFRAIARSAVLLPAGVNLDPSMVLVVPNHCLERVKLMSPFIISPVGV
jgi:hypothetical protein